MFNRTKDSGRELVSFSINPTGKTCDTTATRWRHSRFHFSIEEPSAALETKLRAYTFCRWFINEFKHAIWCYCPSAPRVKQDLQALLGGKQRDFRRTSISLDWVSMTFTWNWFRRFSSDSLIPCAGCNINESEWKCFGCFVRTVLDRMTTALHSAGSMWCSYSVKLPMHWRFSFY